MESQSDNKNTGEIPISSHMEKSRFEITEALLEALERSELDSNLLAALKDLVGRGFEHEEEFLSAIKALVTPPATNEETVSLIRGADRHFQEALILMEKAFEKHIHGNLSEAIRLYKKSLRIFPTAEGHTFLGCAYSFQNRYNKAIEECEQAISVDPDFGNPYNDIGSYLIAQGNHREAITWLKKATMTENNKYRHFAWANLGRVYEALGNSEKALEHFMKAHEIDSEYDYALQSIDRLVGPPERLN